MTAGHYTVTLQGVKAPVATFKMFNPFKPFKTIPDGLTA
jgi:hypothetical protein